MGALGEYPKDDMLADARQGSRAVGEGGSVASGDSALHMVVTTAQGAPGKNGLYRLRMQDSLVTRSTVGPRRRGRSSSWTCSSERTRAERNSAAAPLLENPDVHIAVDPEFAM
jgi:hypothetical protein